MIRIAFCVAALITAGCKMHVMPELYLTDPAGRSGEQNPQRDGSGFSPVSDSQRYRMRKNIREKLRAKSATALWIFRQRGVKAGGWRIT